MIPQRRSLGLQGATSDHLLRTAFSLMANVAITTGLGIIFWVAAARLYPAHTVGQDAALIAAMMELSVICQLNLVNGINRFLPSFKRGTARVLLGVYGVTGALALMVGGLFVVVAPLVSPRFHFLRTDAVMAVLYVLAQALWTWFSLQDAALTAMRRAPWVFVENAVYGLFKLAGLPLLLLFGTGHGVFLATVAPVVLLLVPVNLFLFRTAIPEHLRSHRPGTSILHARSRKFLLRFMAQDYAASVLLQASLSAVPVIVVALVGSRENAYFYISYMIVVSLTLLFYGACTSLVVEGGRAEHQIRTLANRIVRLFAFTVVPAVVVLAAAAPVLLLPFGADYATAGTSVLRILAPGCAFRTIILLYTTIARVRGQGTRIMLTEGAQAVLLILGAVTLAGPLGLDGIAIAWSGATGIVATALIPSLVRFLRSTGPLTSTEQRVTQPLPQDVGLGDTVNASVGKPAQK